MHFVKYKHIKSSRWSRYALVGLFRLFFSVRGIQHGSPSRLTTSDAVRGVRVLHTLTVGLAVWGHASFFVNTCSAFQWTTHSYIRGDRCDLLVMQSNPVNLNSMGTEKRFELSAVRINEVSGIVLAHCEFTWSTWELSASSFNSFSVTSRIFTERT